MGRAVGLLYCDAVSSIWFILRRIRYRISQNIRRVFLYLQILVRKVGSPYFRVHKNKYEEDDYEEL
jgi:hypothetical protein